MIGTTASTHLPILCDAHNNNNETNINNDKQLLMNNKNTSMNSVSFSAAHSRIRKMRRALTRAVERATHQTLLNDNNNETNNNNNNNNNNNSVRFASTGLEMSESLIVAMEELVKQLAKEVIGRLDELSPYYNFHYYYLYSYDYYFYY